MRLKDISASCELLEYLLKAPELIDWHLERHLHNVAQEFLKRENCELLGKLMPPTQQFSSAAELAKLMKVPIPFVVKFEAPSTLGIQTVVVQSTADFKQVYAVSRALNSVVGVVQDFVAGREYTVTVLVGKQNWVTVGTACDYKKQFDGDQGLNTFGMGSVSPAVNIHPDTHDMVDQVVSMLRQRFQYRGFLSCQFIVDHNNKLWLLEHNGRICDPEFQSMAELVDLSTAVRQCVSGHEIDQPVLADKRAVTVGLVHHDWPRAQPGLVNIELENPGFAIWRCRGAWSRNLYWGSVTHSGTSSYQDLADTVYQWLATQNTSPYRFRTDIGKWGI